MPSTGLPCYLWATAPCAFDRTLFLCHLGLGQAQTEEEGRWEALGRRSEGRAASCPGRTCPSLAEPRGVVAAFPDIHLPLESFQLLELGCILTASPMPVGTES